MTFSRLVCLVVAYRVSSKMEHRNTPLNHFALGAKWFRGVFRCFILTLKFRQPKGFLVVSAIVSRVGRDVGMTKTKNRQQINDKASEFKHFTQTLLLRFGYLGVLRINLKKV